MGIHEAASEGFGRAAEIYEQARPGYPPEVLDLLRDELGLGAGARVLDLAAGTGKLTRSLVERGAHVVAVEPVEAMRDQLARAVPGVDVRDGVAEDLPLDEGQFDLVACAQAFHWFDAPVALAETARVLRPSGGLALIWNVRDEAIDWVHRLTEILVDGGGGTPYRRDYSFDWWSRTVAGTGRFTPLRQRQFPNAPDTTVELVVARAASTSFVAALPEEDRTVVLDRVRSMLDDHPDVPAEGTFPFPHETDVFWCTRR